MERVNTLWKPGYIPEYHLSHSYVTPVYSRVYSDTRVYLVRVNTLRKPGYIPEYHLPQSYVPPVYSGVYSEHPVVPIALFRKTHYLAELVLDDRDSFFPLYVQKVVQHRRLPSTQEPRQDCHRHLPSRHETSRQVTLRNFNQV